MPPISCSPSSRRSNDDPVVQRSDVHGVRHAAIMDWIRTPSLCSIAHCRSPRHLARYDDRSAFLSPAATPGPQPSPKPFTGRALLSRLWRTRTPSPEHPFRDELLGIERLEERSLSLAATFTIDPNPRRRASNIFPRFKDNTRVLSEAYRILADDVRTGQFVTAAAEWLLDNFHLVTTEIRDIHQHLPGRYYRQLPALASREHAGSHAHLRHGRGTGAAQRQPHRPPEARRVHQQLSARGPADHWRALGVAQHAEARAPRKPQTAGDRDPGVAQRPPDRRRLRGADRAQRRRECAHAAAGLRHGLGRSTPASRARIRPAALVDPHRRRGPSRGAGHDGGGGDSRRASAAGGRPGVGRERHRQPASLLDAGLAPVFRVGEPGRAGAAARPGRRLRADGLPQPGSTAAGGRGAGGAEWRCATESRAQGGRECAAGGRPRIVSRSRRPRRLSPHRSGTADLEVDVAYRPRLGRPNQAVRLRPRHARLPGPDRDGDGAARAAGAGIRLAPRRLRFAPRPRWRCC